MAAPDPFADDSRCSGCLLKGQEYLRLVAPDEQLIILFVREAKGLLELLGRRISLATATVCGPVPAEIRRLAYCTGSGSSLLAEAEASGADVFVTGDVKYHTALDTRICILDVGHHSLEEEMMRIAGEMLARRLPEVEVFFVPSASPFRRAVES